MLKDVHLIEAASKVDLIVVSLDQKIRKIFATNTKNVNEFSKIVWVNPERDSQENPILWLKNGAKLEKERRLEFYLNK